MQMPIFRDAEHTSLEDVVGMITIVDDQMYVALINPLTKEEIFNIIGNAAIEVRDLLEREDGLVVIKEFVIVNYFQGQSKLE